MSVRADPEVGVGRAETDSSRRQQPSVQRLVIYTESLARRVRDTADRVLPILRTVHRTHMRTVLQKDRGEN